MTLISLQKLDLYSFGNYNLTMEKLYNDTHNKGLLQFNVRK